MESFVNFIKTIIDIDEIDLNLILSKCRSRTIPKGKLLLKKGQIATQYFFIVTGGLRFYYENAVLVRRRITRTPLVSLPVNDPLHFHGNCGGELQPLGLVWYK